MTTGRLTELERLSSLPLAPGLRAHQAHAIGAAENAFANGQRLVRLDMATGSGKTFTALHAVARLMTVGAATRALYLVDRVELMNQVTYVAQTVEISPGQRFVDHFSVYSGADALKCLGARSGAHDAQADSTRDVRGYLCIATVQAVGRLFRATARNPALERVEAGDRIPEDLCDLLVDDELRDTAVRAAVIQRCHPLAITFGPVRSDAEDRTPLTYRYSLEEAIGDGVLAEPIVARTRPELGQVPSTFASDRRVFLVGGSDDQQAIARIAAELRAAGFTVPPSRSQDVPADADDASLTATSHDALAGTLQEIRGGEILVCLLSPSSVSDPRLMSGLGESLDRRGAELIPAILEPCPIPKTLADRAVVDVSHNSDALIRCLRWAGIIDLATLNSHEFEALVRELLSRVGFTIAERRPALHVDAGFDFHAVYHDTLGFADPTPYRVQVKHGRRDRLSVRDLSRLAEGPDGERSDRVLVVTSLQLTTPAIASISNSGRIRIVDGPRIKDLLLSQPDLISKYFFREEAADVRPA